MGWSDRAVSPAIWTPQAADAGGMTLDAGLNLKNGMLEKALFPTSDSRVILLAENFVSVPNGTDLWPNKAPSENINFEQSTGAEKFFRDIANNRLITSLTSAKKMVGTLTNSISAPLSIFVFGTLTKSSGTTNICDQETSRPAFGWGTYTGNPSNVEMFNGTSMIYTSASAVAGLAGSLCLVINGTANKLYINGSMVSGTGSGTATITTSKPLTILNRFAGTYSPGGSINCFLIYAKELNAAEVLNLHRIATIKYPGVVA